MSVTFYPEVIQYSKEDFPCYCNGEDKQCYDCKGTGFYKEDIPAEGFLEMNVANMNASLILKAVLPEIYYEDLCGSWNSSLQDRVSINCIKLLNKDTSHICTNDEEYSNVYVQGVDKDRLDKYLSNLLAIIHCCKKYNCNLNFA